MSAADDAGQRPEPHRPVDADSEQAARSEREHLIDEFCRAFSSATLEPLEWVLDAGRSIDWRAARRSIESIAAADLDCLAFILGITADSAGGDERALVQARELLHGELDLLASALADPGGELRLEPSQDGSLLLRVEPTPSDGLYSAMLDLDGVFVTDAAGLRRPGAPPPAPVASAGGAHRKQRSARSNGRRGLIPRTRSTCPWAQRRGRG